MLKNIKMYKELYRDGKLYFGAWILLQPTKVIAKGLGIISVEGLENVEILKQKERPVIIVASHNSIYDPWKIGAWLPSYVPVYWFAKKRYFTTEGAREEFNFLVAPFIPVIMNNSFAVPIDKEDPRARENMRALRDASKYLKENQRVYGIYPRGTTENKTDIDSSFIRLALITGAWLLPINVEKYRMSVGQPFLVEECAKEDYESMAQKTMKKIEAM